MVNEHNLEKINSDQLTWLSGTPGTRLDFQDPLQSKMRLDLVSTVVDSETILTTIA